MDISDLLKEARLASLIPENPRALRNGLPDYGYGDRYQDSTDKKPRAPKGIGFFGEVKRPGTSDISTEISIGTDYGEVPTMVPGLTKKELVSLLTLPEGAGMPSSIAQKAVSHAAYRRLEGKSPFAGINDNQYLLPVENDTLVGPSWNR